MATFQTHVRRSGFILIPLQAYLYVFSRNRSISIISNNIIEQVYYKYDFFLNLQKHVLTCTIRGQ